jgi:hypothetical protein
MSILRTRPSVPNRVRPVVPLQGEVFNGLTKSIKGMDILRWYGYFMRRHNV